MKNNNKQKWIVLILIAMFIVASIVIAALAIKKAQKEDYQAASELTLITETDGLKEINKYVDDEGELVKPDDREYAILIRTRDGEGRVVLEQYFDVNNEQVMRTGGYCAISYEYASNTKITNYLDKDMNLVNLSSRYSTVIHTNLSEETKDYMDMYFDADGNPAINYVGCYGIEHIYDGDLDVEQIWLDENSEHMICTSGYSKSVRTYDEDKHLKTEMYFDTENNPIKNSKGEYGISITYNSENRREAVTSLDVNGYPMTNSYGYSTLRYTYNEYGKIIIERYYDVNSDPCISGKNFYGMRHDGDRVYYLNKNGHDVISIDSILSNYPFMVSVFGMLVCIVFLVAPRKINIALMILYFLFIMYETVLYRISHQPTMNLELFWSYKQFFSNEGLRIEILNNIWLFVPYSLGLLKTLKKKWIVIALMLLPLFVEIAQYVLGIGLAELDDLLSNGLGELIGIGIWFVVRGFKSSLLSKRKAMNT